MGHATGVDIEIQRKAQSGEVDRVIAGIAERQWGVIARAQLEALGVGRGGIDHRVRLGRLHPLYRAVYAVGQRKLPREARAMAATLAVGGGAVLSHRSAGAHWEILRWTGVPEVTTAARGLRSRDGIRLHSTILPPDEVTTHRGIPVTTVPRTLFDIAAHVPVRLLERAINEAEARRLWDELSLDALLQRYPRHSGNRVVRAALHKRRQGETFTKSDLEEAFVQLVDELRLPRPQINVMVEGLEVDAVWHRERVVVELDARSTHATIEAFERDREKDRILQVAGWHPIRVTARQLTIGRASLIADLKRLLADTV